MNGARRAAGGAPRAAALAAAVLAAAGAAHLFGAGAVAAAAAATPFTCSQDTVLTTVGVDTAAGTVLLAAGGGDDDRGWLIEVGVGATGGVTAAVVPQPAGPPAFGGSIGPGPLFAVRSCGAACLQGVRWAAGRWELLGEPLRAPVAANVYPTYDLAGRPWLVLQGARTDVEPGHPGAEAWGFRLDGREWTSAGHLAVTASGAAGALPAPGAERAVVSGTGRFAGGGPPVAWLKGLPSVPPGQEGEAVPLPGAVAYVDAAGSVYLSRDDGVRWARSQWTPWGVQRTESWQLGRDYSVDLPAGDRAGALPLAWFDRRDRDRERLILTEWAPGGAGGGGGAWRTLADLPAEVVTLDGQHLPFTQLYTPRPGSWLLLAGCVFTRTGSGLVVQTYDPAGGLTPPRFVELRPAGSGP